MAIGEPQRESRRVIGSQVFSQIAFAPISPSCIFDFWDFPDFANIGAFFSAFSGFITTLFVTDYDHLLIWGK
jgi:hypothetical protein